MAVDDGPFKQFLLENVPMLQIKFWPTFWCVESRAQTVFASLLRQQVLPELIYRRELLTLEDGGEIALDWSEHNCEDNSPVILILPGLTGASQSEYIKCLVTAANNIGARVCVFNNRGLGGVALKVNHMLSASLKTKNRKEKKTKNMLSIEHLLNLCHSNRLHASIRPQMSMIYRKC